MSKNKENHSGHTKNISSFLSGGIAGMIAKTIIAPIERIKYLFVVFSILSRKTSNRKFTYQLFKHDFLTIVNKHGILNLWRGNLLNIGRVFPTAAIVLTSTLRISQYLTILERGFTIKTDHLSSKSYCICVELLQG